MRYVAGISLSRPTFLHKHRPTLGPLCPQDPCLTPSPSPSSSPFPCAAIGGATSNNTRAPGTLLQFDVPSAIDQVEAYLAALEGQGPEQRKTLEDRLHILLVGQNNIAHNPRATGADAVEDIRYAVGKLLDAG